MPDRRGGCWLNSVEGSPTIVCVFVLALVLREPSGRKSPREIKGQGGAVRE